MTGYKSYKEQSAHYFARPHDRAATEILANAAAWTGRDLRESHTWIACFSDDDLVEIENALQYALSLDRDLRDLKVSDFPLPTLSSKLNDWRSEIKTGRGFQVVRGLPVNQWRKSEAELFFWCFGLHLGIPGAQNGAGDLLGHVTDTGAARDDPSLRLYKTAANIDYHCDGADVVGLLCLKKAKAGGKSRIVSSVTVFNELLNCHPDLAARLFEPRLLDIRNEGKSGTRRYIKIVPGCYSDGVLRTFYHADYFRSVTRHEDVADFCDEDQAFLDTYEKIAADPDLFLDMELEPGDIQLLSNHTNLHARTDYEDHEDPAEKRHLLRLWLSLE